MRDDARLTGQLLRVWDVVKDGAARTLDEIAKSTGDPQASVSAQLRHLRKRRFGAHTVEKTYRGNGLYAYKVTPNNTSLVR
jgi:DNA-binding transcriptional regulator GbsR (MarR family)